LVIALTLQSVAPPGGNDPPCQAGVSQAIGVDQGEVEPVGQPDRHNTLLAIVSPTILLLKRRAVEDQRGELKVEPTFCQVRLALLRIPRESHGKVYTCIYTISSRSVRANEWAFCGGNRLSA